MTENTEDCPGNKEDKTTKLERDIKTGEICLIIINGLLLISTIVIAVIYNGQLKQMRRATRATQIAADAAKESADITKIQFILQSGGKVEPVDEWIRIKHEGQNIWADVVVRNTGQIIATDLRIAARLEYLNDRPKHNRYLTDRQVKMATEKPGALPQFHDLQNGPYAHSPRIEVSNENHGNGLYVWGTIFWKTLGEERTVQFCRSAPVIDVLTNMREGETQGYGGGTDHYKDCFY